MRPSSRKKCIPVFFECVAPLFSPDLSELSLRKGALLYFVSLAFRCLYTYAHGTWNLGPCIFYLRQSPLEDGRGIKKKGKEKGGGDGSFIIQKVGGGGKWGVEEEIG